MATVKAKAIPRILIQARVKQATQTKLKKLAEASNRKLAAYVAILLEDHARRTDLNAMRALARAWSGVKEDRNSVVRAKDGPRK